MKGSAQETPPWRCRNRSRSRAAMRPGHPQYNPAHPLASAHLPHPQPSTALAEGVEADIEKLKREAEWCDKMRPFDPEWVADVHGRAIQIQNQLLQQLPQFLPQRLFERMPRNPCTMRYEQQHCIDDKKMYMKRLLNLHTGEVLETWGHWENVPAPLPESKAWYHAQYSESKEPFAISAFLVADNHACEHFRRISWGFTLARLMDKFGEVYTFETIYEVFVTLPIMVGKKKRGSHRTAW